MASGASQAWRTEPRFDRLGLQLVHFYDGWSPVNILLVDDDVGVGKAIGELLQSEGHVVTLATLGSQALQLTLARDFDLMLCDVMLPDFPGLEVIRAVKAQAPQLPVIVLTGVDAAQWQRACEDAGAALFLAKPIAPADILREVALVQMARLNLRVVLVDTDPIHRTRLTKTLVAIGCTIDAFGSAAAANLSHQPTDQPSLWVVDAADPDILGLVEARRRDQVPVFAFGGPSPGQEEQLMRAGVALFLAKPIDIDSFLTQASFMAR